LAISENEEGFIIKAVLAMKESEADMAAHARKNVVYDAINRLNSPKFHIGMNIMGDPQTPPPGKKMRERLKNEVKELDYDDIVSRIKKSGINGLPKWPFKHDGWNIEFYPLPKGRDAIGKPGVRPIGLVSFGYYETDPIRTIRDAILSKVKAYGKPKLPFVIAVNSFERHVDYPEIMQVLFGEWKYTDITFTDGSIKTDEDRNLNGVWTSRSGPRNAHVSAILFFQKVTPWDVARSKVRLYHNPYISGLYRSSLTQLPQVIPNCMKLGDGKSLALILELSPDWPEEE